MTKKLKYNNPEPELRPEVLKIISEARISWNRSKEEIWPELWERVEGKAEPAFRISSTYHSISRYAAAAAIMLLFGISAFLYGYTKTIRTSGSVQAEVLLPDNSRVTVFAHSYLSYKPLIWQFSRRVKMEGEGRFEVQKGKTFAVISKRGKTNVLGTEFLVYSRNKNYNVTCFSGKVKVIERENLKDVVITGGQKAILKPEGNFEIVEIENTIQPSIIEKSDNQLIIDELNDVLSQSPAKPEKGTEIKPLPEPEKTQTEEVIQNSGQEITPQTQTGNNEEFQISTPQSEITKPESDMNQNSDKFRASLTQKQISILENQQMNREEKRKAFMQSLSPEQLQLLDEQNRARARQSENVNQEPGINEQMREQQRIQEQDQIREGSRRESREQQRLQKDQNLESGEKIKPGSNMNQGNQNKPESGNEN